MADRNFTVTVKERQAGEPCLLVFETDAEIGTEGRSVQLDLAEGTSIEDAEAIARTLNGQVKKISLTRL